MEYETLKTAAEAITMPDEMKRRIVHNCKTQILISRKELMMKNTQYNTFFRKPAAVFAALAIVLSLSATALAAMGIQGGFFRDIKNWQGAVVGTSYEQATDEINLSATVNGNDVTALATFSVPQEFPYREAETLGIAVYQIVDGSGRIVKEGSAASVNIVNGQAALDIHLDGIASGTYKLIVSAFVAGKKAEQPLNIHGSWECEFTR